MPEDGLLIVGRVKGVGSSIVGRVGFGSGGNFGMGADAGIWNEEAMIAVSSFLSSGHGKYSHSFDGSRYASSPPGHLSAWASHNTGSPFTSVP